MNGEDVVRTNVNMLVREVREDASNVAEFEQQHHMPPRFAEYFGSHAHGTWHAVRAYNGAVTRRQPVPGFVRRLQEEFGPNPVVLDIGCGYGTDSFLLAQLGCRVVGVDVDANGIAVARYRAKFWKPFLNTPVAPDFIHGSAEAIESWPVESFHGVFTAECLHHCEPVENVLITARRLLPDRGGRMLVLESNASNPLVVAQRNRVASRPRRVLFTDGRDYWLYGNENIRPARRWRSLFRECGLHVCRQRYSRHLMSEVLGTSTLDRRLCRILGARAMSIHVSFELTPLEAQQAVAES